jgi:hypothetical protein
VTNHALQAGVVQFQNVKPSVVLVHLRRQRGVDALQQSRSVLAEEGLQGNGMQAECHTQMNEEAAVHFAHRRRLQQFLSMLLTAPSRSFRNERLERHAIIHLSPL